MENSKEKTVEISTEPKISARFGFAKEGQSLSKQTIKYCFDSDFIAACASGPGRPRRKI